MDEEGESLPIIRTRDGTTVSLSLFRQDDKLVPFVLARDGSYEGPDAFKDCVDASPIEPVKRVDHLLQAFFRSPQ